MTSAETLPSGWRQGWSPAWIAAYAVAGAIILVLLALILWREWIAAWPPAPSPAIAERLSKNLELEREIATLTAAPVETCTPADAVKRERVPEAAESPAAAAALEQAAPTAGSADAALSNRELVALLNEATALVLIEGGSASGFFIAPDLLVTNRHAGEGSGGMAYVTSKSLGRVHRGRVLAASPDGSEGAADFALVRVEGGPARRTLAFSHGAEQLMPVIAAGYPGLTIVHDAGFRALLAGDITAAPELVLNRGEIQALQRSPQGLEVFAHSGRVLQGNSGGPLVDACGRVVGINTYIAVDASQAGHVSYAIATGEMIGFLSAHGAGVELAGSACLN